MKNLNQILATFSGRVLIYLSIFIAGTAIHEFLVRLIQPVIWSSGSIILSILTLGVFVIVGSTIVCQQHAMSRVTSAATLFILCLIAFRLGRSVIPDPYLLVAALGVAALGAQPALHRKLKGFKQTVLYSLLTILVTLITAIAFTYAVTVLNRIYSM